MSQNLNTKGTVTAGDVLLKIGKLDKNVLVARIGVGGVAIATTSMHVTPYVLPAQAVVYDAFLNVLVPSTGGTKTLSVGTSATPLGFINGLSVASSGLALPFVAAGTSASGNYGSLLTAFTTGNNQALKTYASDANASKTITFTPGSTDWVGGLFSADLYLSIVDLTL